MKRIARDPKPSRSASPDRPARAVDDRHLRDVRGGSSVIKPEQMAQVTASGDWQTPASANDRAGNPL
jgi:hypothetical protein